jgi:hypothetical protein
MNERGDTFDGFEDDMYPVYPYGEIESDFPVHFPNQPSENDDFWDKEELFRTVTSKEDFERLETLMNEADARADAEDTELLQWERSPLRHLKKAR